MKLETQSRDDHQITMVVELEPERMEGAKHRAARRISERKSIPGFRPGKAPYDVIVRTFGESVIVEEAVDLLLDEIYPEALKESKVDPAAPGSLEKVEDLETRPKFTFIVPLAPSVSLGDYRSIRLPYKWHEPGDDKLKAALEDMRQMYAKTETVNRPVKEGDFVLVDLKGVKDTAKEGEPPQFERSGFPVFVRVDKKDDEWPFPGFSKELVGLNGGDEKSFTHEFSKDSGDESIRGQIVVFNINVKMVRGTILPELNDEFAKTVGPFTDLHALRDAMKANLAAQSKSNYDDEYYAKLIEKIKEGAVIKYAPQTVDHEMEHVMDDIKSRLAEQKMDLAAYLKTREMTEEKFIEEEAHPVAVKRLERSLVMEEIAHRENLELDKELLNKSFQQTWGELQTDHSFQKSMRGKSQPSKQLMNAVARESASRAYIQQTLERMKAIATGEAAKLEASKNKQKVTKKATTKSSPGIKTSVQKRTAADPKNKNIKKKTTK